MAEQKGLDRPELREKIDQILIYEGLLGDRDDPYVYAQLFRISNQILALLIPDIEEIKHEYYLQMAEDLAKQAIEIEEAKTQERERVMSKLEDYYRIVDRLTPKSATTIKVKHYPYLFGLTEDDWQSLEGGK